MGEHGTPGDADYSIDPGTYVEAVRDPAYRGWVIGQWNDNRYMMRVVWETPVTRIDIGAWEDVRPAERTI